MVGLLALGVAVVAIPGHAMSSSSAWNRADSASVARSWIAFERDASVWLVSSDGSKRRLLARGASGPVWSPDGRRVAFTRAEGGRAGIYVINVSGRGEKRLTAAHTGMTTDGVLSWSPNGRLLAFYRHYDRPGTCGPLRQAGDLFVMKADGTRVRRLTRHGQAHYSEPVWSPDSRMIAFVSCHGSPRGDPEIYVINTDGSGERRLTRRPGWDGPQGWSRDGRTLLVSGQQGSRAPRPSFDRMRKGAADLFLLSADGRTRRNLTRSSDDEFGGARWSPDEQRIAFVRVAGGGTIWVMNANGRGKRGLNVRTVPDFAPTWSPDGRQLVFSGNGSPWQVHVINADGTNRRNLAEGIWPVWSPARR